MLFEFFGDHLSILVLSENLEKACKKVFDFYSKREGQYLVENESGYTNTETQLKIDIATKPFTDNDLYPHSYDLIEFKIYTIPENELRIFYQE